MYSVTEEFVKWLGAMGYRASTRAPSGGGEFVTVERTGGGASNMVDHPMLAVQAWAEDEARAEEMANEIRLAALTSVAPFGVHRIDVNSGPYAFFDESTRMPRYQVVLDVSCQLVDYPTAH